MSTTKFTTAPDPLLPLFAPTRFTRSVSQLAQLGDPIAPEVAFVGRSNVGKSSAINALVNQRQLAISSKTPGRTRLINLFEVPAPGTQIERTKRGADLTPEESGVPKPPPVGFLVDLPGYGYARITERERLAWDKLIGGYIQQRDNLNGVVILIDARHGMKDLDESMLVWALEAQRDVLLVANKADKLTQSELSKSLRGVSATIEPYQRQYQTPIAHCAFSSQTQKGAYAIRLWIAERMGFAV